MCRTTYPTVTSEAYSVMYNFDSYPTKLNFITSVAKYKISAACNDIFVLINSSNQFHLKALSNILKRVVHTFGACAERAYLVGE